MNAVAPFSVNRWMRRDFGLMFHVYQLYIMYNLPSWDYGFLSIFYGGATANQLADQVDRVSGAIRLRWTIAYFVNCKGDS